MKFTHLLAVAAMTIFGSAASAATISLNTAVPAQTVASIPGQDFQAELANAGVTHLYTGPMTLIASGPAKVSFSLVATESNFTNSLFFNGTSIIVENGNEGTGNDFSTGFIQGQTFETMFAGGDLAALLSFAAVDAGGTLVDTFDSSDDEFGVFANSADIGALSVFYIALDDSGANLDDNHDDIIVRVEIAAVPLPASGLLLLAGLGGAFGMRRFRRKA